MRPHDAVRVLFRKFLVSLKISRNNLSSVDCFQKLTLKSSQNSFLVFAMGGGGV